MAELDEMKEVKRVLVGPLISNNPIALQVLGVCSALAVTTKLETAFVMTIAVTLVTAFSSMFISMIPPPYSQQRAHYRADGDHRLAGDRRRSAAARLRLRSLQTAVGVRRAYHHQLYRDGGARKRMP
ncbi:Na(+)-translocating NADH-quinone reductase subunit D [Raoultella ornithinolytica]|nr:Na(+)-translocating NADH-quinone reductase subunit D [Raoultella ornithinolytica]